MTRARAYHQPLTTDPDASTMRAMKAKTRNAKPASAFAYPRQRKYPIDTPARARNALARAAQTKTSGSYRHVAEAVRKRYGNTIASVGRTRGTVTAPGYRKRGR